MIFDTYGVWDTYGWIILASVVMTVIAAFAIMAYWFDPTGGRCCCEEPGAPASAGMPQSSSGEHVRPEVIPFPSDYWKHTQDLGGEQ